MICGADLYGRLNLMNTFRVPYPVVLVLLGLSVDFPKAVRR